jgi:hypothetical protein
MEEEIESLHLEADPIALLHMMYLPVMPDKTFQIYPGILHTRETIVKFLQESNILHPVHNIEREK